METITITQTVAVANFFVFIIVFGIGIFYGLDLKRWSSWLYGLYGFLSLFIVGFLFVDAKEGLIMGAVAAFVVMYTGATIYWQRQWAKGAAESWLSRYGQDERLSLLARLIKKSRRK